MDRLELYKELYFKELERKEQISSRLQWTISFWVLVVGGILYSLNNVHKIHDELRVYFYIILVISLLLMIRATFHITRCLWGRKIKYIPDPRELDFRYRNLVSYYADYKGYEDEAELQFDREMEQIFKDTVTSNTRINDVTVTQLVKSMQSMSIAAVFLLISFFFILPDFIKGKEPVNKIEIINGTELNKTEFIIIDREEGK